MTDRVENLLGVLALLIVDEMHPTEVSHDTLGFTARAALNAIGMYPGCSIEQLRTAVDLSHPAAVRAVASLVDAELVQKKAGPDKRTVSLVLSKSGRQAVNRTLDERERMLKRITHHLDESERKLLDGMLLKILWHETRDARHAMRLCRLCDDKPCLEAGCPVECREDGLPMPCLSTS